MFRKLREPFGTAGLVVAVIALVFALGGGAWALSTAGRANHRHDLAKRHARGVRGPQGPQGPEGPEGPAGANGKNGVNGKAGANGTNGTPGKSVLSGKEPAGENCEQGGYWFELQGTGNKQYVCNGSGGGGGTGGGGAGGTELAPGDTSTGTYAANSAGTTETDRAYFSISFPLRVLNLGDPLVQIKIIKVNEPGTSECPGSSSSPEASPGFLCVYEIERQNAKGIFESISDNTHENGRDFSSGAILYFEPVTVGESVHASGTWAVTAPCPSGEPTC